ncbi:MAG TPA: cytochrome c oxidase subunit II [Rhizobiaceae bacterium]|nr:cytochrome c oxidase subunit II [Rhizobiaceae bacterium]
MQSALDPAGEEASQVATLFWVMACTGLAIWASVILLSLYAARWKRGTLSEQSVSRLIPWAGVAFPVVVLTALLSYALWLMPSLRPFAGGQGAGLHIAVEGNQFWWRVIYRNPDGTSVASANEVRLPVGERVEFSLTSADMIHSFWIPVLGGKMDLIPGRTNRLSLLATKAGTYRGQCAEFCGASHALMAFPVVVMEPGDFNTWLSERGVPSAGIAGGSRGEELFTRAGCGACHRIDGTDASGAKGPDLSHIGSRLTIAAGLLENDVETIARFISHPGSVKPGSQMPAYLDMQADELVEIATWLKGLR